MPISISAEGNEYIEMQPRRGPVYTSLIVHAHCSGGNGGVAYVTRGSFELPTALREMRYRVDEEIVGDGIGNGYTVVVELIDSYGRIYTPYYEGYTYESYGREVVPHVCKFFQ